MVVLILGYSLYTLASKFGDRVHISLQVESLGLKYSLAYKFGDKVYFILPVHFSHNIPIHLSKSILLQKEIKIRITSILQKKKIKKGKKVRSSS